jgi:hypothetical protein
MRSLMPALLVLLVAIAGCDPPQDDDGPGIVGSRQDVATPMGVADGVEVTDACDRVDSFGLLAVEPTAIPADMDATQLHEMTRALVDAALADAGLPDRSGWGSACQGLGASLSVHDWGDVDARLEALRPVVAAPNVVNDVVIVVEAPPAPD